MYLTKEEIEQLREIIKKERGKDMNPNSLANLRPANKRTPEELTEISKKGGEASGKVRKKYRAKIITRAPGGIEYTIIAYSKEDAAIAIEAVTNDMWRQWHELYGE